jgi:hypothetical protein
LQRVLQLPSWRERPFWPGLFSQLPCEFTPSRGQI